MQLFGISPNDVDDIVVANGVGADLASAINQISALAQNKKVVAIGEIGLDYYWNKENKDLQKEIFVEQIELANRLDLPIVIHTRDAIQDTIDILKEHVRAGFHARPYLPGVFHCCPLNRELVKEALKLGFYISFAGPVTFKNSKNADEIVRNGSNG